MSTTAISAVLSTYPSGCREGAKIFHGLAPGDTAMTVLAVFIAATALVEACRLAPAALGCHRGGRSLLITAQERTARAEEILQNLKYDFDLNVHFGLRKIGINPRSGEEPAGIL